MEQLYNNMDDLLVKHLLQEATTEERAAVDAWLQKDAANRKHYEHLQLIWEQSRQLAADSKVDTDAAWQRFQQRVAQNEETAPAPGRINLWPRIAYRVAASLILLIGIGFVIYRMNANDLHTVASNDQVVTDTLPDGSVITLNRHSSITYPEAFTGNTRSITMNGEAFFRITPDKSRPFIIRSNGIDVKVVGTSFNVKSSAARTEVIVETGVVEVRKKKEAVLLNPQEQAVVTNADVKPVKAPSKDQLYNYYRTNEFSCHNTPLWRLVDVLRDVYRADILIEGDALKNKPISTTFRDNSLDEIMDVITSTYPDIYVEKANGKYVIKPR